MYIIYTLKTWHPKFQQCKLNYIICVKLQNKAGTFISMLFHEHITIKYKRHIHIQTVTL